MNLDQTHKNLEEESNLHSSSDFEKNRYLVIRGAISKDLAEFIYTYFANKRLVAKALIDNKIIAANNEYFGNWTDTQIPNTYSHYSDIAMETLLQKVKPVMEKATGIKLVETYSYARIYKKGDTLHRHKDRLSCEISTTLNLGGSAWSIFLEPDSAKGGLIDGKYVAGNTAGVEIKLEPGDMLIYRGCELEHWREPYESDGCTQVFLHYNNATSPHAEENRFDRRPYLGLPSIFRKKPEPPKILENSEVVFTTSPEPTNPSTIKANNEINSPIPKSFGL